VASIIVSIWVGLPGINIQTWSFVGLIFASLLIFLRYSSLEDIIGKETKKLELIEKTHKSLFFSKDHMQIEQNRALKVLEKRLNDYQKLVNNNLHYVIMIVLLFAGLYLAGGIMPMLTSSLVVVEIIRFVLMNFIPVILFSLTLVFYIYYEIYQRAAVLSYRTNFDNYALLRYTLHHDNEEQMAYKLRKGIRSDIFCLGRFLFLIFLLIGILPTVISSAVLPLSAAQSRVLELAASPFPKLIVSTNIFSTIASGTFLYILFYALIMLFSLSFFVTLWISSNSIAAKVSDVSADLLEKLHPDTSNPVYQKNLKNLKEEDLIGDVTNDSVSIILKRILIVSTCFILLSSSIAYGFYYFNTMNVGPLVGIVHVCKSIFGFIGKILSKWMICVFIIASVIAMILFFRSGKKAIGKGSEMSTLDNIYKDVDSKKKYFGWYLRNQGLKFKKFTDSTSVGGIYSTSIHAKNEANKSFHQGILNWVIQLFVSFVLLLMLTAFVYPIENPHIIPGTNVTIPIFSQALYCFFIICPVIILVRIWWFSHVYSPITNQTTSVYQYSIYDTVGGMLENYYDDEKIIKTKENKSRIKNLIENYEILDVAGNEIKDKIRSENIFSILLIVISVISILMAGILTVLIQTKIYSNSMNLVLAITTMVLAAFLASTRLSSWYCTVSTKRYCKVLEGTMSKLKEGKEVNRSDLYETSYNSFSPIWNITKERLASGANPYVLPFLLICIVPIIICYFFNIIGLVPGHKFIIATNGFFGPISQFLSYITLYFVIVLFISSILVIKNTFVEQKEGFYYDNIKKMYELGHTKSKDVKDKKEAIRLDLLGDPKKDVEGPVTTSTFCLFIFLFLIVCSIVVYALLYVVINPLLSIDVNMLGNSGTIMPYITLIAVFTIYFAILSYACYCAASFFVIEEENIEKGKYTIGRQKIISVNKRKSKMSKKTNKK